MVRERERLTPSVDGAGEQGMAPVSRDLAGECGEFASVNAVERDRG